MEFNSIPDIPEESLTDCVSYNNSIILGKYQGLDEARLRGRLISDSEYLIDISCGNVLDYYTHLKDKIYQIIQKNPLEDLFKNIPSESKVEPYVNDTYFNMVLNKLLR